MSSFCITALNKTVDFWKVRLGYLTFTVEKDFDIYCEYQTGSTMYSLTRLRRTVLLLLLTTADRLSGCTLPGESVHFELVTGQVYTSPNHMLGRIM